MAKNKLAKFADMATYSNVFQYDYETLKREGFPLQGRWSTHFKNDYPITLELGCGKGEYTVGLARKYPGKNFIGIDIKGARMWKGATQALKEKITNATFLRTRVELLNRFFSENEVSEIWITFPDPQPKKETKRLTSPRFLNLYLSFLQPGAVIHLKTDSRLLHDYTRQVVETWEGFNLLQADTDVHNSGRQPADPLVSVRTFYEDIFLAEGKPITYLKFSTGTD